MAIRIVQVGIANPAKGHKELDRLEAEGFAWEDTKIAPNGGAAVVTLRQGPQTVRDCALYGLSEALYADPIETGAIVAALRRGESIECERGTSREKVVRTCAAMLDCFVGDGLDMRIVDPRAVVEAPKPVAPPAPPPFVLNTDELLRAACFDAWDQEGDEPVRFRANVKGLRALVDGMFVTGDESHAGDGSVATPTLREFLRLGEKFTTAVFTGTAKPPADGQSNVVIDGVSLDVEPMAFGGSQRYMAAQAFSQFKYAGASHFDDTQLVLVAKWGTEAAP